MEMRALKEMNIVPQTITKVLKLDEIREGFTNELTLDLRCKEYKEFTSERGKYGSWVKEYSHTVNSACAEDW